MKTINKLLLITVLSSVLNAGNINYISQQKNGWYKMDLTSEKVLEKGLNKIKIGLEHKEHDVVNAEVKVEIKIDNKTKEYFTKYPFVNSISWKQYTNYWNDGEACYFSVQTPEIEFTQEYLEANPTLGEELKKHYYENSIPCEEGSDEEYISDCNKFYSLLCEYDEYFKLILGDHIEVRITKEKIRTEDYSDHD